MAIFRAELRHNGRGLSLAFQEPGSGAVPPWQLRGRTHMSWCVVRLSELGGIVKRPLFYRREIQRGQKLPRSDTREHDKRCLTRDIYEDCPPRDQATHGLGRLPTPLPPACPRCEILTRELHSLGPKILGCWANRITIRTVDCKALTTLVPSLSRTASLSHMCLPVHV